MNLILVYTGALIIIFWGISHIVPTKSVVRGFGNISKDNKLTITMEWIVEGITLIFVGILPLLVVITGDIDSNISSLVLLLSSALLFTLAVLSAFTGARTSIVPMKLCPYVKSTVAVLYILGIIF